MNRILLLTSIFTFACPLFASQVDFLPDSEVRELVQGVKEDKYPEVEAVILLSDAEDQFDEEGKRRLIERTLVKVLTEEGKKDYATIRRGYNPQYNEVKFLEARMIKADGEIVGLPLAVKTMPSPGWSIFWGGMQRVLEVRGLEVGSAIEYIVQQRGVQVAFLGEEEETEFIPPMKGQFYNVVLFQDRVPILKKRYVLNGPKSKPVQHLVVNGNLKHSSRDDGESITHIWEKEDIPRVVREPAMPPLADVATKLVVTTIPSWQWISRWMSDLSDPGFEADEAIREKIKELTKGAKTDEESLRALYDFVAKEIRYVGLSMGKGEGYTPHPAPMTFRERGGVCKDKAGLLVCMLREAGFPAYIATTMVGGRVEDIPADQFNHAIVALRNNGGWLFLDPTMGGYDLTPNFEQGQGTLVATPEGEDLCEIPWVPPEKSVYHIIANSALTPEGDLTGEAIMTNTGISDYIYRRMISYTPPPERRRLVENFVKQISPNAELTDYSLSDEKDFASPLEVKFKFRVKDYGLWVEDLVLLKPISVVPELTFGRGSFWDAVYTPDRRYPIRTGSTQKIAIESVCTLPAGYHLKGLPEPFTISNNTGEFSCSYRCEENKVISNARFAVNFPLVSLEEVPKLRAIVTQTRLAGRDWIVIRRGGKR